MKFFPVWLAAIICCACAGHAPEVEERNEAALSIMENCPALYVIAPGNYIIDLAAEANVILDPAWHEFVLYCNPLDAHKTLNRMIRSGFAQKGEWRIYTVEGFFENLVRNENGRMILARPARLQNWLEDKV